METGFQLASKLHKRSRSSSRDVYLADRISELPDEILTDILSRLTMREAVRTSVLSRRWKDLWTFTTGSLDFEFGSFVLSLMKKCSLFGILEQERARYINRVNKILNSHKGATIEELKIEFDLRLNDRLDIDSWINFAIRKKVRRLDLKLEPVNIVPVPLDWDGGYPFPAVQCLGNNSLNISCLTSLNLNFVNVTDEVLEYLLSNCPFLEFVRILNSPGLEGVRVLDPCPKLKHLEIAHCYNLAFLDISSAPSLASLTYSGPQDTTLCFRNVPNLSDVSLGSFYGELKVERFSELPIALSQIEKLKFSLCEEPLINFPKFPELKNVKQLELELQACDDYSLLSCASVIEACPKLYRLSIQFDWLGKPREREVKQRENCSIHKCLKVVELVYFRGSTTDVELATYLLSSTPFLEKIMVDTRCPYLLRSVLGRFMKENVSAKECVRRLVTQLSPSVELVTV